MMRLEEKDVVRLDDVYTQGEECFGLASSYYGDDGDMDGYFTACDSRYSHLDGVFNLTDFSPVELTEEELTYQKYDSNIVTWEKVDGGYLLTVRGEYAKFTGRVKYVHELQHAMRVCGYEKLADNYKI